MSTDEVTFESSDGLTLEAILDDPDEPRAALVLCHPHPKMGGTMNAPLLAALTARMTGDGWTVLRFNFRGIGKSEGDATTGIDEVQDAKGAIAYMRHRTPDLPLAIAGWSFGAAVAIRTAAEDDSLVGCVRDRAGREGEAGGHSGSTAARRDGPRRPSPHRRRGQR